MKCPKCGNEVVALQGRDCNGQVVYKCKNCVNTKMQLPAILGCDTFQPHYDSQIGEWFESKEHKAAVLKEKGLYQLEGTASPKGREGIGRIKMTKGQYERGKDRL